VEMLKRLREAVRRKRPVIWPNDSIFHYVNAPAHNVFSVKQFRDQKSITGREYPPYSPNMALNDFWLFPKIKPNLKGRRFQDAEIQDNMTTMETITQHEFQKCFQQWQAASLGCSRGVLRR
jgi:hypothetical protein